MNAARAGRIAESAAEPRRPRAALARLRRMGIDTYQTPVAYLRRDAAVCRSEGFESLARVEIRCGGRRVVATLNVITDGLIDSDEVGLSEAGWRQLAASEGETAELMHPRAPESLSALRSKVYGHALDAGQLEGIVRDVAGGLYSDLELAAFVTACAGERLDDAETLALTRAMADAGERLRWPGAMIMDKHCIGGLPGNRTSLIVVPIVAACGYTIPKTSSRAITSPAGTADTMEVLAPVALDLPAMRQVVEREGGCIVWGGSVCLSPADDVLIRVERPLDFDSGGQLVASVLSKKLAAGSTHVLIDIPVGPTAKVRDAEGGRVLARRLREIGGALGLDVRTQLSDGSQPVGRGVGPVLEARDVLQVLRNEPRAPADLRDRALALAGEVLVMAGRADGPQLAARALSSGAACSKFEAIAEAQGGLRTPRVARFRHEVRSAQAGVLREIDNRRLARLAKLAGAPRAPAAGVDLHVRAGDAVSRGQPLFTLHAETRGELAYALDHFADDSAAIRIGEPA